MHAVAPIESRGLLIEHVAQERKVLLGKEQMVGSVRDHTHGSQAAALPAQLFDQIAAQAIQRGQRQIRHLGQVKIHPRRTELAGAQLAQLTFENQAGLGRPVSPHPDTVDL